MLPTNEFKLNVRPLWRPPMMQPAKHTTALQASWITGAHSRSAPGRAALACNPGVRALRGHACSARRRCRSPRLSVRLEMRPTEPPRIHTAAQCAGTAAQREPLARPSTHSGLQPADARPASRIRHSHAPCGRAPPVTPHPRPDRCRLLACCRARASCRQQRAPAAGSLASHATLPHTPTPATASRAGRRCAALAEAAARQRALAAAHCSPFLRSASLQHPLRARSAAQAATAFSGAAWRLPVCQDLPTWVQKVHIVRHTRSYAQALRNFASAAAPQSSILARCLWPQLVNHMYQSGPHAKQHTCCLGGTSCLRCCWTASPGPRTSPRRRSRRCSGCTCSPAPLVSSGARAPAAADNPPHCRSRAPRGADVGIKARGRHSARTPAPASGRAAIPGARVCRQSPDAARTSGAGAASAGRACR